MLYQGILGAVEVTPPPLDWTQIIVQSIITLGVIVGVLTPAYLTLRGKLQRTEENTDVVRAETRNAHAPDRPMRHDIDVLLERTARMDRSQRNLEKDVGGMRADIRKLYENDTDLWDTLAKRHQARSRGGS